MQGQSKVLREEEDFSLDTSLLIQKGFGFAKVSHKLYP